MAPVITGLFLAFLALHTSVAVPQRNERRDGHEGNSASAVLLPRMEYVMDGHAAVPVPYDLPEVDESDSDDNFYVYPGGGEADHDCRADEEIGYEENGYAKRSLLHHLLERAKKDFSIRDLISTITGKKYGPSFNADPKQRALWAEKNQEGKWKLGKRNVFKKSTPKLKPDSTWERDHVLEIQRFEHLWKGDQPKDAGFLAGSWQRMKEATNKNTDPNSSPEKKLWGSTIHHTPNLIKIEKKANKLKGVIVCQSNKASAGPKLAKSWSRSQLWFVIVYIQYTKPIYENVAENLAIDAAKITGDEKIKEWAKARLMELHDKDVANAKAGYSKPVVKGSKKNFLVEDMGDKPPSV